MEDLKVTFGDATLAPDQLITKAEAQKPIKFYWPKEVGKAYSVIIYDDDAVGPDGKPYIHYRAEGVVGSSDGRVVQGYRPPNPPSGVHRYWVVVADQASSARLFKTSFRVAA